MTIIKSHCEMYKNKLLIGLNMQHVTRFGKLFGWQLKVALGFVLILNHQLHIYFNHNQFIWNFSNFMCKNNHYDNDALLIHKELTLIFSPKNKQRLHRSHMKMAHQERINNRTLMCNEEDKYYMWKELRDACSTRK